MMTRNRERTYIYSIELFTSQGLRANRTGETIDVIDFAHRRATIAFAYDFFVTFVTHSEVVTLLRHLASNSG